MFHDSSCPTRISEDFSLSQIYTAEEKQALALVNFAAQKEKEAKVLTDLRKLVERSLEDPGGADTAAAAAAVKP